MSWPDPLTKGHRQVNKKYAGWYNLPWPGLLFDKTYPTRLQIITAHTPNPSPASSYTLPLSDIQNTPSPNPKRLQAIITHPPPLFKTYNLAAGFGLPVLVISLYSSDVKKSA